MQKSRAIQRTKKPVFAVPTGLRWNPSKLLRLSGGKIGSDPECVKAQFRYLDAGSAAGRESDIRKNLKSGRKSSLFIQIAPAQ